MANPTYQTPVPYLDKDGCYRLVNKVKDWVATHGGTARYRHNIVAKWNDSDSYNYESGSIGFSFIDTVSTSYSTGSSSSNLLSADAFMTFMTTHCHLSEDDMYPVSGGCTLTSRDNTNNVTLLNITSVTKYSNMWYVGGTQTSKYNGSIGLYCNPLEIAYLTNILPQPPVYQYKCIEIVDIVEDA